MGYWEAVATIAVAIVGSGAINTVINWLFRRADWGKRKIGFHARIVLEQADAIYGCAKAMRLWINTNDDRFAAQAWLILQEPEEMLNVWLANRWVLSERKESQPFRESFPRIVEILNIAAVKWYDLTRNRPPGGDRETAKADYDAAYKSFRSEFQKLHNAVQPMVYEYVSKPDSPQVKPDQ